MNSQNSQFHSGFSDQPPAEHTMTINDSIHNERDLCGGTTVELEFQQVAHLGTKHGEANFN